MADISHNEDYANLIEWMVENKIELSSLIKIDESPLGGVGVFSTADIAEGDVVLRVPKDCVLSPVTCGIANLLDEHELDGMIGLTIAYMFEKSQGEKSPWFGFLKTIRPPDHDLPRFWPEADRQLLKGTEMDKMGGLDDTEVLETYKDIVAPFIEANKQLFRGIPAYATYDGYREALVEVTSRAFEVDDYRGLSLVPGACLFNHSDSENVHFESQGEVCELCGAANYCDHIAYQEIEFAKMQAQMNQEDNDFEDIDSEEEEEEEEEQEENGEDSCEVDRMLVEPDSDIDSSADEADHDHDDDCACGHDSTDTSQDSDIDEDEPDSCELVVMSDVSAGKELFNTYGEYNNGVLLSRYGFAIWDNQHESVGLASQVLQFAKQKDLKPRLKWWAKHFYQCVFDIDPELYEETVEAILANDPDEPPPPPPDSLTWKDTLEIVSSGQPTPGLILVINLLALSPQKFALLQTQAKRGKYSALPTGAQGCSKILVSLVNKKLSTYKDANLTSQEYAKLINQSDISHNKRLAFTVIGTEKLVLERFLKMF
ncbi:Rkm3p [Sugiyamaella lignohabitans]|uniref:Rkm3p n=1 Tax=Sugiyamaella lignohabitans TaxID=796027 RepID=A0A170QXX9_9ASCO|nr:Rkm3p [Sugiyamaella lignohabitans]ANB15957.1 Rkm3p [Sugiyamaella lignohabitans]